MSQKVELYIYFPPIERVVVDEIAKSYEGRVDQRTLSKLKTVLESLLITGMPQKYAVGICKKVEGTVDSECFKNALKMYLEGFAERALSRLLPIASKG